MESTFKIRMSLNSINRNLKKFSIIQQYIQEIIVGKIIISKFIVYKTPTIKLNSFILNSRH